jgi:hypothetical protein
VDEYGALVETMIEENQSTARKTCPGDTVPTTKPTGTDLGLQKQRQMVSHLRSRKAYIIITSHTGGSYFFRILDILTPATFITKRELQTLITNLQIYIGNNLQHRTVITSFPS